MIAGPLEVELMKNIARIQKDERDAKRAKWVGRLVEAELWLIGFVGGWICCMVWFGLL